MNYRHVFHAGNFADVFKHCVLVVLLHALRKKEKAFCYLDTHAGAGIYDLFSSAAQKSKEYENGIQKIYKDKNPPLVLGLYLDLIRSLPGNQQGLRYYPGSAWIAKQLLRTHDRMIISELNKEEYQSARNLFLKNSQAAVHHQDGYQLLKAFLPPKEKRGLIFIDPPYENLNEFNTLLEAVPQALKKFETGVYALWYPIKERKRSDLFINNLRKKLNKPVLVSELIIYPADLPTHLNGSGMLIVNPPWETPEIIQTVQSYLFKHLA